MNRGKSLGECWKFCPHAGRFIVVQNRRGASPKFQRLTTYTPHSPRNTYPEKVKCRLLLEAVVRRSHQWLGCRRRQWWQWYPPYSRYLCLIVQSNEGSLERAIEINSRVLALLLHTTGHGWLLRVRFQHAAKARLAGFKYHYGQLSGM